VVKFSKSFFTNLLLNLTVKNFINRSTFSKIAGKKVDCMLNVDDREQKQFPAVMLKMQTCIIDRSVGCAV